MWARDMGINKENSVIILRDFSYEKFVYFINCVAFSC